MPGWIRLFGWCASLWSLLALSGRLASAADQVDDDLIHQGVEARRRGDDSGALELFKKAYLRHQSARAAGQMGLAEVALGRWLAAETHLEEATAARSDPWIQKNLKTLEATLVRVRQEIGTLEILGPDGAEVIIGGEVKGTLPLREPIHVRAGDVNIEIRASGRVSESRRLRVVAGELTRETVEMSKLPLAPRRESPTLAVTLAGDERRPTEIERSPVLTNPETGWRSGARLRVAGIVLMSLGVATAGGGVAFGLKARSSGNADSIAPRFDPNAEKAGRRFETLQWVGYGVGAALLVGGVTTYLIGGRHRDGEPQVAFVAIPGMALASLKRAF